MSENEFKRILKLEERVDAMAKLIGSLVVRIRRIENRDLTEAEEYLLGKI